MWTVALGWLSSIKTWPYAVALALLIGGGLWLRHHWIDTGYTRGAARVQKLWDRNLADIAELAAKAEAANKAALQAAQERNRSIVDDYEKRIADSDTRGADLARRLRGAQASTRSCPMPEANGIGSTAPASGEPGREEIIDERLGAYDAACQRDSARLNALIAEITPQL